jgi:WD40 repeat protein
VFSPDGKHVGYIALTSDKPFNPRGRGKAVAVVVDGNEEPETDSVSELTFSPDSKRHAYVSQRNLVSVAVVDGREFSDFIGASHLTFSPDSKHVAWIATGVGDSSFGSTPFMVLDGQRGQTYDAMGQMAFTSDGHLMYSAKSGDTWRVVKDRNEIATFTPSERDDSLIRVSHDGKMFWFARYIKNTNKWAMVINGHEGPQFGEVDPDTLHSSREGDHVAYVADMARGTARDVFVVADGQGGPSYDAILDNTIEFTNDGELQYLAIRNKTLYRITGAPPLANGRGG